MNSFTHPFQVFRNLLGLSALLAAPSAFAQLKVDFTPAGGEIEAGFAGYFAAHEDSATFTTQDFSAFGSTITTTPAWPDTTDNRVRQMIERGAGNNANWVGDHIDFLKDFIGVDTRTANGGNGDFDGTTGTPTTFTLTLSGLPAKDYSWLSYHHDTEHVFTSFLIEYSSDSGATFTSVPGTFSGTDSTPAGTPASPQTFTGTPDPDPANLPSTARFNFSAKAGQDFVIRFTPLSKPGVHQQVWIMNAFEIMGDADNDGMPDVYELANGLDPNVDDAGDDLDDDGLTNIQEYRGKDGVPSSGDETNPDNDDSDNDGLSDGQEINELASNPLNANTDGDAETTDTDGSGQPNKFSDLWEFLAGSDLSDGSSYPDIDDDGYSTTQGDDNDNDIAVFPMPAANQLFVDFNSDQNAGGDSATVESPSESDAVHNQLGYRSYHANHEVTEEFTTATYDVFGSNVTLTPGWPDSASFNTTQQSIDRGNGNDRNWHGDRINLLTDWIGVDTRASVNGNGPFDGVTGNPSRFNLTLGNLPSGTFSWRSYHHDTENVHADFAVAYSTDGGITFTPVAGPNDDGTFSMTDSTAGGTPASTTVYTGAEQGSINPADLPSTVEFSFTANGSDDVIIEFTPYATAQVHQALVAVNGFELTAPPGLGSGIAITSKGFNESGAFVIDFRSSANTSYEILKSTTLDNDFTSIDVFTDTDGSGNGQFIIPSIKASEPKAFFVIQPINP